MKRCVPILVKEGKDQKQATAICHSMYKQHSDKKESSFTGIYGMETKNEDGKFTKSGYIATTHLDTGWYKDNGTYVRDKILPSTLFAWAEDINSGNPNSNKLSLIHNREPLAAGVMEKGSARIDKFDDGEYGLYVDTNVDTTMPNFETVKSRFDNGFYDAFSIEYDTGFLRTGSYYPNAAIETPAEGFVMRTILPGAKLQGAAYLDRPMNEYSVITKSMSDLTVEVKGEQLSNVPEVKVENKAEGEKTMETSKIEVSAEDFAKLTEIKSREVKDKEYGELKSKIMEELKPELDKLKVETKALNNPDKPTETREMVEFKEAVSKPEKFSIEEQFRMAGRFAESKGLLYSGGWKKSSSLAEGREYKNFTTNGTKLEFKGLGITTNQSTDTDYLLSAAELNDVFDPVIYNAINQAAVTWNILRKEDYSNKGNNMVQFKVKTVANPTANAYLGNAVSTGNATRLPCQTKFKKYQVGVEVDGDMIAAARGSMGDIFAKEVQSASEDLIANINADLFGEKGAETDAEVIGFEYISDSAGNTTLYGYTRSSTTLGVSSFLQASSASDNYINASSADITLDLLRQAKRQAIKEGAKMSELVFITDHIQGDKIRGIYMDLQRLVPTSARAGFEGMISMDGIPVYEDKDCNDDDVWLVPLNEHKIGVWVPSTLEMLGKDSDAEKGFIKTYFATFNTRPRALVQIYGCATS